MINDYNMEEKIIIKNENIVNYVMFKLDKVENGFTREELAMITELNIDFSEEENKTISFSELLKFPNLTTLRIRNWYIENYDFSYFRKLEKLNSIAFERCEFDKGTSYSSVIGEVGLNACLSALNDIPVGIKQTKTYKQSEMLNIMEQMKYSPTAKDTYDSFKDKFFDSIYDQMKLRGYTTEDSICVGKREETNKSLINTNQENFSFEEQANGMHR